MRSADPNVVRYRAIFGLAYLLFGALALVRVLVAHAPANAKILGTLFGLALIGLGIARLVAFQRVREELRRR